MIVVVLIVLLLFCFGGASWGYSNGDPQFGHGGIGLGGLLVIILIFLIATGRL